jgi:hypothetical protein
MEEKRREEQENRERATRLAHWREEREREIE